MKNAIKIVFLSISLFTSSYNVLGFEERPDHTCLSDSDCSPGRYCSNCHYCHDNFQNTPDRQECKVHEDCPAGQGCAYDNHRCYPLTCYSAQDCGWPQLHRDCWNHRCVALGESYDDEGV